MGRLRRRVTSGLLIISAAVGLFVGSDHLAREYAESEVADRVVKEFGRQSRPDAKVLGWPVIFAFASGNLEGLDLVAHNLHFDVSGVPIELEKVKICARALESVTDPQNLVIGSGKMRAVMSFTALDKLGDLKSSYLGDGRLGIKFPMVLFDAEVMVTVAGKPWYDQVSQRMQISDVVATMDDVPVPDDLMTKVVNFGLSKLEMPTVDGVKYRSFRAQPEGIVLEVELANLHVAQFLD